MPTYEYKCDNCGHQFDIFQSMKDDKLTVCPNCGKNTLKRLIGKGGGLIFKGSGFYLTDYKNKPSESSTAGKTGADTTKKDTTAATTEAPKTESKTAAEVSTSKNTEKKSGTSNGDSGK